MRKFTLAASVALLALIAGCANQEEPDTTSGSMGVVSCPRGKDCSLSCCKDGKCRDGGCDRYNKTNNSGSMGVVACAHGDDCTMSCCKDGMCTGGSCKPK